jgi:hypothetical protein
MPGTSAVLGSKALCLRASRYAGMFYLNSATTRGEGMLCFPRLMGSFKQDLLDFMALGRAADTLLLCN